MHPNLKDEEDGIEESKKGIKITNPEVTYSAKTILSIRYCSCDLLHTK